jgi:hypothetical protein
LDLGEQLSAFRFDFEVERCDESILTLRTGREVALVDLLTLGNERD